MNTKNKIHFSLIIWVLGLIAIGGAIGFLTKPGVGIWYSGLNRSTLTPPNHLFPVVWTILYGMIGVCGWRVWCSQGFLNLIIIKSLYVAQLILNWSWTPLFFHYHLTGLSLVVLLVMDIVVGILVFLSYPRLKAVAMLMLPYLAWILFASYLNFYIWRYN